MIADGAHAGIDRVGLVADIHRGRIRRLAPVIQHFGHVMDLLGGDLLGQPQDQVVILRPVIGGAQRADLRQRPGLDKQKMADIVAAEQIAIIIVRLQVRFQEVAGLVDLVLVRVQHARTGLERRADHHLDGDVHQQIVVVEEGDVLAAHVGEPGIGRAADAEILLQRDTAYAGIVLAVRLDPVGDLGGFGAVVDDDQFPVAIGLGDHGIHRGGEIRHHRLVGRHQDADQRLRAVQRFVRTLRGDPRAQPIVVASRPAIVVAEIVGRLGHHIRHVDPQAVDLAIQAVDRRLDLQQPGLELVVDQAGGQRAAGELDIVGGDDEAEGLLSAAPEAVRQDDLEAAIRIAAQHGGDIAAIAVGLDLRHPDAVGGDEQMTAADAVAVHRIDPLHPAAQRPHLHAVDEALEVVFASHGEDVVVGGTIRIVAVDIRHDAAVSEPEADPVFRAVHQLDRDREAEAEPAVRMAERVLHVLAQFVGDDRRHLLAVDQHVQRGGLARLDQAQRPASGDPIGDAVEIAEIGLLFRSGRRGAGGGGGLAHGRSRLALRACSRMRCAGDPTRARGVLTRRTTFSNRLRSLSNTQITFFEGNV